MDRWIIVTTLNYLPHDAEVEIVLAKAPSYDTPEGRNTISAMVRVADMTRNAFIERRPLHGDEPAHGDHLGARTPRFSAILALPSASLS